MTMLGLLQPLLPGTPGKALQCPCCTMLFILLLRHGQRFELILVLGKFRTSQPGVSDWARALSVVNLLACRG